jgi:hypothetical protein
MESAFMTDRCGLLANVCRHAGNKRIADDEVLSAQAFNCVTFLEQLIHVSREVCRLKFSKTTDVKPELLSIVAKARVEWLNRNLLLNTAIMGKLMPPDSSTQEVGMEPASSSSSYSATAHQTQQGDVHSQLDKLERILTSQHQDMVYKYALPLIVVPCHHKALRVLKLVEEETLILNSASRSPLMITLEVLECEESTTDCILGRTNNMKQSMNASEGSGILIPEPTKQAEVVINKTSANHHSHMFTSSQSQFVPSSSSFPLNFVNPSWVEDLVARRSAKHRTSPTTSHSIKSQEEEVRSNDVRQWEKERQEQMTVEVVWRGWGELWSEKVKRIKVSNLHLHSFFSQILKKTYVSSAFVHTCNIHNFFISQHTSEHKLIFVQKKKKLLRPVQSMVE